MYKNFNIKNILKDLIIWFKPHLYLGWLVKPLIIFCDTLIFSKWINENKIEFSFKKTYLTKYKKYDLKLILKNLILHLKLYLYLGWFLKLSHLICHILILSKEHSENKKKIKNIKNKPTEYLIKNGLL